MNMRKETEKDTRTEKIMTGTEQNHMDNASICACWSSSVQM